MHCLPYLLALQYQLKWYFNIPSKSTVTGICRTAWMFHWHLSSKYSSHPALGSLVLSQHYFYCSSDFLNIKKIWFFKKRKYHCNTQCSREAQTDLRSTAGFLRSVWKLADIRGVPLGLFGFFKFQIPESSENSPVRILGFPTHKHIVSHTFISVTWLRSPGLF